MPSALADRIREAMALRGVNQSECARRAGLHRTQVGSLLDRLDEGGEKASANIENLRSIARGLQVSERWLVLGQGTADSDDSAGIPVESESATPTAASLAGWDDAEKLARIERPDLTDHALTLARRAATQMVRAATPELVIKLAELATQHAGGEDLQRIVAERIASIPKPKP